MLRTGRFLSFWPSISGTALWIDVKPGPLSGALSVAWFHPDASNCCFQSGRRTSDFQSSLRRHHHGSSKKPVVDLLFSGHCSVFCCICTDNRYYGCGCSSKNRQWYEQKFHDTHLFKLSFRKDSPEWCGKWNPNWPVKRSSPLVLDTKLKRRNLRNLDLCLWWYALWD